MSSVGMGFFGFFFFFYIIARKTHYAFVLEKENSELEKSNFSFVKIKFLAKESSLTDIEFNFFFFFFL